MASLARDVSGAELVGDGDAVVRRMVHPSEASREGDLAFLMAAGAIPRDLGDCRCAIVARELAADRPELLDRFAACVLVDRPRHALVVLSRVFARRRQTPAGIHPSAVVEEGAEIGGGCSVGAHVWIGGGARIGAGSEISHGVTVGAGAVIGRGCRLHPGVFIGDGVEVGDRVIIHPNAVIGGDGFAFDTATANSAEGARRGNASSGGANDPFERIESLGTVRLEDDVEIGACTTIDRSTLGTTVVREGTKIDNLVQIGHGNTVGSHGMICSQVGIAGSCEIGDRVILAGKVGVSDHRKIGDDAVVMAKSGVTKDVPPGAVYYGMPASPVKRTLRNYSLINRIGEMRKQIRALEEAVRGISSSLPGDDR